MQRTRYSAEELAELQRRAGEAGYTVGAYCRACALGDAGPRARRRVTVDRELIARNTAQLNHIGSNLNQMARALNQIAIEEGNGRLAQVVEAVTPIDTTLDALRTVLAANRRALGYDSEG
jgi:Bacterial mobilisation protein (MobC)